MIYLLSLSSCSLNKFESHISGISLPGVSFFLLRLLRITLLVSRASFVFLLQTGP
jgi:hypothetical protein